MVLKRLLNDGTKKGSLLMTQTKLYSNDTKRFLNDGIKKLLNDDTKKAPQ